MFIVGEEAGRFLQYSSFVSDVAVIVEAFTLLRETGPAVVLVVVDIGAVLNHCCLVIMMLSRRFPICTTYSVLSVLFRALPLPVECVIFLPFADLIMSIQFNSIQFNGLFAQYCAMCILYMYELQYNV